MSILIKGIPLAGYEISIMKDGERYRARVDGIWCEIEEIPTTEPDTDTISRQAAIDALRKMQTYKLFSGDDMLLIDQAGAQTELMMLPPAQPEKLTDIEQRIFLAAMSKEEKVCREVDKEPSDADCINLMRVCKSIERKVKGALWT